MQVIKLLVSKSLMTCLGLLQCLHSFKNLINLKTSKDNVHTMVEKYSPCLTFYLRTIMFTSKSGLIIIFCLKFTRVENTFVATDYVLAD